MGEVVNIDEIRQLVEQSKHSEIVCLLGENPTTYSKSRIMWNSAFVHHGMDAEYIPLDVSSEDLERVIHLLLNHDIKGFNITNPYKERVSKIHYIEADDSVKIIGGVNTVHATEIVIRGYSTDGYGAIKSLEEQCGENQFRGRNVVVLGAGGSGSAIAVACAAEGSRVVLANRDFSKAKALCDRANQHGVAIRPVNLYSDGQFYSPEFIDELKNADIVINTLPIEKYLGKPIFEGEELSGKAKICMDIVYGHRSYFLELAEKCGHQRVEGQWMLLYQGVKAFEIMFQYEMAERGLTTPQIIAPMRYALNHFKFNEPNGSVQEKVLGAKEEISSKQ